MGGGFIYLFGRLLGEGELVQFLGHLAHGEEGVLFCQGRSVAGDRQPQNHAGDGGVLKVVLQTVHMASQICILRDRLLESDSPPELIISVL